MGPSRLSHPGKPRLDAPGGPDSHPDANHHPAAFPHLHHHQLPSHTSPTDPTISLFSPPEPQPEEKRNTATSGPTIQGQTDNTHPSTEVTELPPGETTPPTLAHPTRHSPQPAHSDSIHTPPATATHTTQPHETSPSVVHEVSHKVSHNRRFTRYNHSVRHC